jgi:hypothetical protein
MEAGAVAERAALHKTNKYRDLRRNYTFCAVAIETMGPISEDGVKFLEDLGRRLSAVSGDPRESAFLFQRISILIQRCNAISIAGTFESFLPAE